MRGLRILAVAAKADAIAHVAMVAELRAVPHQAEQVPA